MITEWIGLKGRVYDSMTCITPDKTIQWFGAYYFRMTTRKIGGKDSLRGWCWLRRSDSSVSMASRRVNLRHCRFLLFFSVLLYPHLFSVGVLTLWFYWSVFGSLFWLICCRICYRICYLLVGYIYVWVNIFYLGNINKKTNVFNLIAITITLAPLFL